MKEGRHHGENAPESRSAIKGLHHLRPAVQLAEKMGA
jgi:hypothetical protein